MGLTKSSIHFCKSSIEYSTQSYNYPTSVMKDLFHGFVCDVFERFGTFCTMLKPVTLIKATLLSGCFWRFLNCTNGTKSHNASLTFLLLNIVWRSSPILRKIISENPARTTLPVLRILVVSLSIKSHELHLKLNSIFELQNEVRPWLCSWKSWKSSFKSLHGMKLVNETHILP